VSGHDFSRADKPFFFAIPSGLQAARELLFRLFPQPVQPCRQRRALTQTEAIYMPEMTFFRGQTESPNPAQSLNGRPRVKYNPRTCRRSA